MPQNKELLDFVTQNREGIEDWVRRRPSINEEGRSTYEDLLDAVQSGKIKVKHIPDKKWEAHKREVFGKKSNAGGFYSGDVINIPKTHSRGVMPHEAMHYFASHWPEGRGTPKKINPYIKADMAMGGWLPSLHQSGRRPHIGGKLGETKFGNWWNVNKATKRAEYSNTSSEHGPYHPWFDEHAFNLASTFGDKSNAGAAVKKTSSTKKSWLKKLFAPKETSFSDTFRKARKEGMKEFDWKDKKYHTKYKEEMRPKEESWVDKWKKWNSRGSNY